MSSKNPNKKVGRSIEEVLVRRKFDSSNPITWPDGHPSGKTVKISQSLPDLNPRDLSQPGTADRTNTSSSHIKIVREIAPPTSK